MRFLVPLLIKFIMITAALWIVLGFGFSVSFGNILVTSMALTIVSFLIGDLFLLPQYENTVATMADFGLAFAGVWAIGYFLYEQPISLRFAALLSALLISVGEIFFHRYIAHQGLVKASVPKVDREDDMLRKGDLQTEFGSEITIKRGRHQTKARRIDRRHYLDDR